MARTVLPLWQPLPATTSSLPRSCTCGSCRGAFPASRSNQVRNRLTSLGQGFPDGRGVALAGRLQRHPDHRSAFHFHRVLGLVCQMRGPVWVGASDGRSGLYLESFSHSESWERPENVCLTPTGLRKMMVYVSRWYPSIIGLAATLAIVVSILSIRPVPQHKPDRIRITTASGRPLRNFFDGLKPDAKLRVNLAHLPKARECGSRKQGFLAHVGRMLGIGAVVHAYCPGLPCMACEVDIDYTYCHSECVGKWALLGYKPGPADQGLQMLAYSLCNGQDCNCYFGTCNNPDCP